ncbi:putative methyltransferase-domain-containing protein [Amylocystis lapponica]|nr:putative methyltransferase-domain-containing protein [Amylocystis lapponica]
MTNIDLVVEERLDALDPLRHFRNDDDPEGGGIVPVQPPSIQDRVIELSFPSCSAENVPNPAVITLAVDASPGCGGIAWPAGEVLSAYIAQHGSLLKGKNVLELGSGTGLVGLVAGVLGAAVWITDQAPLLDIMRRNVEINNLALRVSVAELNWGEAIPQDIPRPDVILAADCVYFEPAFPLLVKTLADLVADDSTEVLFCYKKRRKADKRFFTLLKKEFTWTEVEDDPQRAVYSREAISLLRLVRKPSGRS